MTSPHSKVPVSWLTDHNKGSFDAIAMAAVKHVGEAKVQQLAQQRSEEGQFWQAALLFHITSLEIFRKTNDLAVSIPIDKQCMKMLAKVEFEKSTEVGQDDLVYAQDLVKIRSALNMLKGWDPEDHAWILPMLPAMQKTQVSLDCYSLKTNNLYPVVGFPDKNFLLPLLYDAYNDIACNFRLAPTM